MTDTSTHIRDFQGQAPRRASTSPTSIAPEQQQDYFGRDVLRPLSSGSSLDRDHVFGQPRRRRTSMMSTSTRHPPQRSSTVKTYRKPDRPNWQPGAEPGIDTTKEDDGLHHNKPCEITIVDYSDEHVELHEKDNDSLKNFLEQSKADWVDCRWICVNGISWDVVKLLGNYKGLHRLAIEDLLNTRSRTKADWYPDHCFIVLTLAKLVRLYKDDGKHDDEHEHEHEHHGEYSSTPEPSKLRRLFRGKGKKASETPPSTSKYIDEKAAISEQDLEALTTEGTHVRTLQNYHGGPDQERLEYMESKSTLASKDLAVSVEQVSIFLTEDNTIISIFEHSAPDILQPICDRLASKETILRRTSDGSMLVQALIDAIIDLAMPVAAAYDDAIASLELQVLMDPKISQPKRLYILSSELTLLKGLVQPVASLVGALKDHHPDPVMTPGLRRPSKMITSSSVSISPLAYTYLGDVQDHILSLSANLDTMRNSVENLTSLLFNMMGAFQNETMRQLTLVTIFFLPLTFLVGYFGQNFEIFWAVHNNSDGFFWIVAAPTMLVTSLFLMRGAIGRQVERIMARRKWKKSRYRRARYAELAASRRQDQSYRRFGGLDGAVVRNGANMHGEETVNKAKGLV